MYIGYIRESPKLVTDIGYRTRIECDTISINEKSNRCNFHVRPVETFLSTVSTKTKTGRPGDGGQHAFHTIYGKFESSVLGYTKKSVRCIKNSIIRYREILPGKRYPTPVVSHDCSTW